MREIVIATNYNDWEGLYINGVLATEGHSLTADDILFALDINYVEKDAREYLKDGAMLPFSLSDLDE